MSAEWSFGSPAPATVKRRGGGLVIGGVVLVVLALVAGVIGTVVVARAVSGLTEGFGSTYGTPAVITRSLDGGTTYAVYEMSTLPSAVDVPGGEVTTVPLSDITVTAPGGYEVPVVEPPPFDGTFTDNGSTFVPVATFDAPTTGSYDITVVTEGTTVAVGPGFGSLALTGVGALVVGLAVLVGIVGIVLLVVGLVLRSRKPAATQPYVGGYGTASYGTPSYGGVASDPYAAQPAPAPYPVQPTQPTQPWPSAPPPPAALPPAGWYPDPERPGGQRYWDGARWTDHRA